MDLFILQDLNQPSVCVRKAHKSYGSKKDPTIVFQGLNATVPKGSIYTLLGASGCGKTTLLTCMMGYKKLDAGELLVLGETPDSVPGPRIGYMPQSTGLYGQFTIGETLQFHGWLAGMAREDIQSRLEFLLSLLMLPSPNQRVNQLSGGEQRRVSLAAALLHEPELMILDEPTVGLDPVTREKIWGHFSEITKAGRATVIITTHYVDEAQRADVVALMRDGRLLAEDSPGGLLTRFGCQTLSEVFVKLSHLQDEAGEDHQGFPEDVGGGLKEGHKSGAKIFNSNHLKALLWKNWLWMVRNVRTMGLLMLLPLVQTTLFCFCIGNDPRNLPVAVTNYELDKNVSCAKSYDLLCNNTHLSCNYLEYLKQRNLNLIFYDSEDLARVSVLRGSSHAAITVRHNYSAALRARIPAWGNSKPQDVSSSEIEIFRDASNKLIADYLTKLLYETYQTFFQDLMAACDTDSRWLTTLIKWESPVYGTQHPSYTNFGAPGIIVTFTSLLAVVLTSVAILSEHSEGSLERSLIIGVKPIELLFAHALCHSVVMVLQTMITLICVFAIFDITLKGSLTLVVLLTLLTGVYGIAFGLCVSCVCDTIEAAFSISMGFFVSMVLLCGIIWPIEGAHYLLQVFVAFLPLTKVAESLRSIMQRGWGFSAEPVYMGFVSISAWIIIVLTISILALKFKRN